MKSDLDKQSPSAGTSKSYLRYWRRDADMTVRQPINTEILCYGGLPVCSPPLAAAAMPAFPRKTKSNLYQTEKWLYKCISIQHTRTQTHIRLHWIHLIFLPRLNSSTVLATEVLRLVALSTEFKPSLGILFLVMNNDSLICRSGSSGSYGDSSMDLQ